MKVTMNSELLTPSRKLRTKRNFLVSITEGSKSSNFCILKRICSRNLRFFKMRINKNKKVEETEVRRDEI